MAASQLTTEQPIIDSGYAWLLSEANLHNDSDRACGDVDLLDKFDELVAAEIVATIRKRGTKWSTRATGNVVLDILDRTGMLEASNQPVSARDLVLRAHGIARKIVPTHV